MPRPFYRILLLMVWILRLPQMRVKILSIPPSDTVLPPIVLPARDPLHDGLPDGGEPAPGEIPRRDARTSSR